MTNNPIAEFEQRKKDHIDLSLSPENEASGFSLLDQVDLVHEALPEMDFNEVSIENLSLNQKLKTPFLVSSMTAGHVDSTNLNLRLAKASFKQGWLMGVGSQRRELFDAEASKEWLAIRKEVPDVKLLGNLGLSQLIHSDVDSIRRLVGDLRAEALFVHTNPLQEVLQMEGTPQFKGGLKALELISKKLDIPVILKECGCGFSKNTLKKLNGLGLAAVDISGFGGTHWGRIEGARAQTESSKEALVKSGSAKTFSHWGISTVESLLSATAVATDYEVWASGGVRSGLDAAKLISMGASTVGLAKPILSAALKSEDDLINFMSQVEYELKVALFCTGLKTVAELRSNKEFVWIKK